MLFQIILLSSLVYRSTSDAVKNSPKLEPSNFIINVLNNTTPVKDHLKNEELLKPNSAVVTCISNERVTSENHFQDTRFIKFTLENLTYDPGDVLIIRPHNSEEAVDHFFKIFKNRKNDFNENSIISVSKNIENILIPPPLEEPVAFKTVVKEYFNLNNVPRKYIFEIFSDFTDIEEERQKLMKIIGPGGANELFKRYTAPRRNILEVLEEFPGVVAKIPFNYLFDIFQNIRPCSYSIASSTKAHKGELHILVAVVKYKTELEKPRIGLCSNCLASFRNGTKAAVFLGKGFISLPKPKNGPSPPAILIGPGTGIAPFRSYVYENADYNDADKNYVFFGCRSKTADNYFADEWDALVKQNKTHFFTAFSRDQPEKIYVQHIIEKNGEKMWELIARQNASVYVCGNAIKMPGDVKKALISAYSKYENVSESCAEKFFKNMEKSRRYQTETW